MTENPNFVDVLGALALQAELCLKQLSDVEIHLANWHANGCSERDFPLEDFQKIDLIRQRLSDIQAVLNHTYTSCEKQYLDAKVSWAELKKCIALGETRAAIARGSVAINEAEAANGNLTIF